MIGRRCDVHSVLEVCGAVLRADDGGAVRHVVEPLVLGARKVHPPAARASCGEECGEDCGEDPGEDCGEEPTSSVGGRVQRHLSTGRIGPTSSALPTPGAPQRHHSFLY